MRILIDTNVILDIIQKREPFFADSYQALCKAIKTDVECLISASAVTDIFYMLRKAFHSSQKAKERIEQLSQIVTFADVQGVDIHTALMRSMPDFEDAVVDTVAKRSGASYILTRNIKDFAGSCVPAPVSATAFLDASVPSEAFSLRRVAFSSGIRGFRSLRSISSSFSFLIQRKS